MIEFMPVVKDEHEERPIPTAWRTTFLEIVRAFRQGEFSLSGIPGARPLSAKDAQRIRGNIDLHGVRLLDLPDATWRTSVYRWMGGYWEVLIDLSTEEEGDSDLVLFSRVHEKNEAYEFEIESVHVP